ncbi:hypothetical protein ACICHK_05620 [Streptomyces sp. AHU1]|uniref:hypothetical protein n=1 Tax=Streptomyces sp. AHU1 TaxID=3377215 RepID=UPI003877B0DC
MLHAPPGRLTLGVLLPTRLDHPSQELLAMEAERGRVDALFAPAPHTAEAPDPVTLLSGLSGATDHIGLVAAGSPSGWEPHQLVRRHTSLDVLSTGRAGWHLTDPAGTPADEALRLWTAAHRDGTPGAVPPVQRQPVLFRTDEPATRDTFTARHADVVLTAPRDRRSARRRYAAIADGVRAAGRNPEHVLIWSELTVSTMDGPARLADHLQRCHEERTADGFLLSFPEQPGLLVDFVDHVVPELWRRGLFPNAYEGPNLRATLGLPEHAPIPGGVHA